MTTNPINENLHGGKLTSPLLTTRQAAEYLNLSQKTLRQKAKVGEIAYIEHNPRCWAFLKADLDRYIQNHRIQAID